MTQNPYVPIAMLLVAACSAPPSPSASVVSPVAENAVQKAPAAEPPAPQLPEPPPSSMQEHSSAASGTPSPAALTRVEPSKVCMVNNAYMGREQIPVQVQGKTYFGCCEMCEGRLAKDPSSRMATDPVSGKTVDKASAVIGKDESGAVLYFENEKNFVAYASR